MPTKPLRVLQVINSLKRGGAETLLINYHRAIDRSRIQFDYLLSYPLEGDYENEAKQLGGRIFRISYKKNRYTQREKALYLIKLLAFLATHRYPIIHVHLAPQAAVWSLRFAKILQIKHRIIHSHNTDTSTPISTSNFSHLQRSIADYATDFFACSEDAANFLFGEKLVKNGKTKVLINAINAKQFLFKAETRATLRKKLGLRPNDIAVGSVARLERQKNHLFMVEIIKLLKNKWGDRWTLVLVGNGSLAEKIRTKIDDLGVTNRVIMVGESSEVASYLSAFDLMLLPSLHEGTPLSAIEAQAAGLPVLASQGRVPEEVACTNLMHFLPLEDGVDAWAEWIAHFPPTPRLEGALPPGRWQEGYDMASAAPRLTALYETMEK